MITLSVLLFCGRPPPRRGPLLWGKGESGFGLIILFLARLVDVVAHRRLRTGVPENSIHALGVVLRARRAIRMDWLKNRRLGARGAVF